MSGEAFALLHPKIQHAVYDEQWSELRPLQVDAIHEVLETENNLILSAATASGKTEAAFLPILSKLAQSPQSKGVRAIYVSPLKALINDQFRRLEKLCSRAEIPVHKWHGDVSATAKRDFRKTPNGILLITPESLESNFINYGKHLSEIYGSLEFVVIDELHAFLEGVRGMHLLSLIARVRSAADVKPRMLGLSATLGDYEPATKFLSRHEPEKVTVLSDEDASNEKKVGLRSYLKTSDEEKAGKNEEDSVTTEIAKDLALHFRRGSNLIFTNSRGLAETLADRLNTISKTERWPDNPFVVHHGSISREGREDVEKRLKSGEPITPFCTSTLEMGIDIGSVKAVGQLNPTWTVNSLVQRLGRSGRKSGESSILRGYVIDDAPDIDSDLAAHLYPNFIRFIALIELMLEKWLEPLDSDDLHLSTCIHQIISILRQTGGITAEKLHRCLCLEGAFHQIDHKTFALILRGLGKNDVVEQMSDGTLILSPKGEHTVESKEFYAAFLGSEDYSIRFADQVVGSMPSDVIPPVGQHLLLSGRRWLVDDVDHQQKTAFVKPGHGYTKPDFLGNGGSIHHKVMQKMRSVLDREVSFPYLNSTAQTRLELARKTFHKLNLNSGYISTKGTSYLWFPWVGTRALLTIATAAMLSEIKVDCGPISIEFEAGTDRNDIISFLEKLAQQRFDPLELADHLSTGSVHKFDDWVLPELLSWSNSMRMLDTQNAANAAKTALAEFRR